MDLNELSEQLKFSDSNVIYVVTWNNEIKKVFTPFKIIVSNSIGNLLKGEIAWVQEIKVTYQYKTVFIIEGNAYYHYHFGFIVM